MKFGQNLPRNQVPEWAASYINYKKLKKLIKAAQAAAKQETELIKAGFFFALDRNLEDVDEFYNKKHADSSRRLKLLHDRYGDAKQNPSGIDRDEAEDLMGALLELRGQLRKLQWFGEVNRRGFTKITKKFDKKVPGSINARERYLETKVDPLPFASNSQLSRDLSEVNEWLSTLGEAKVFDDTASIQSSASLKRVSSKAIPSLPKDLLDTVDQAVRSDDASILSEVLLEAPVESEDSTTPSQTLLLNLLQRSISCKSKACIDSLLRDINTLDEDDDVNRRNCIHRLVIAIGRSKTLENQQKSGLPNDLGLESTKFIAPAESPFQLISAQPSTPPASEKSLDQSDDGVQLLIYLLDRLHPRQRPALQARDAYGRLPLHYAAQYGFTVICQEIIKHMQDWDQFDMAEGIDAPDWQDSEGYTPLHLSVMGGHVFATKALLESEDWQGVRSSKASVRKAITRSGEALALATKSDFTSIVQLLVDAGVDINYQDDQGETALHLAARFGHELCAEILIEGTKAQKADLEIAEKTFSWTPLFVACVEGHLSVVEQLIAAGADLEGFDSSGWSAKEHAALRGNLEISRRLAELTAPRVESNESGASPRSSLGSVSPEFRPVGAKGSGQGTYRSSEPVKTFGHRYLTNDSMVLVSLGTMDSRKEVNPIKLDRISIADAHATQLDTALSVVISASGAAGELTVIDLPVQENISTDPVAFTAADLSKVKLLFDIIPTYAGTNSNVIGRGVALLSSLRTNIGSKRISLHADISVPIVAAATLEVIGSVNFNFLIVTPFTHPNMKISEEHTYWKKMASTMVIGHRGLGKNVGARKSLQLGENTIQSFIAAANLGASYVEFDVQMTKDLVPVIYHDFLVSETGIDAPVHTLTLEQFLHVGSGHGPNQSSSSSPTTDTNSSNGDALGPGTYKRRQSYSAGMSEEKYTTGLSERMKHTRDFKIKGFKGNSRGHSIKAPFTTLEEMFKQLPDSVGFNIEMKYPMLFESEEQEMDNYAVELNSFVDNVLAKVYDLGGKRNVIFSSFNPEICILLSLKQPSIPILFLTDAGTSPTGDIRAGSLQEAIRFAGRWNLLGVVSAAEPLVQCPRLVKVVKESGLVCVTYGTHNNDPENLQVKEGIDAVIVDSVLAIRKGLTGLDAEPNA
ncbi:MAG: hypothetical protein Q9157_006953 [Trypethelium eluteriae]